MKILVLIHSMHAGGAERVTAALTSEWAEREWEVHLVTLAGPGDDFYPLHPSLIRTSLGHAGNSSTKITGLWANMQRIAALRRVLKAVRPDVVIGMMSTSAVLCILASRGLGLACIASERSHPPMMPLGRFWAALRRLTYPAAARVVMLTSDGLAWLEREVPRARGAVIPNPVSRPLPIGQPILPPADALSSARNVLLAVGRLDEGKQFELLVECFGRLVDKHPSWDLVILGEGDRRRSIELEVSARGLCNRVHLPGRAGNMSDWYARADLYVSASRFEGFPNTLAEAMAHGCPVVAYDCDTGPRDLIRDGVDGLLVRPVSNVPALTSALDRLMADRTTRTAMARMGLNVLTRYSPERIFGLWDEALGTSDKRAAGPIASLAAPSGYRLGTQSEESSGAVSIRLSRPENE